MPRRSFALPANWYREIATRLIEEKLPPLLGPLTTESAWRYVYACVMWAEMKEQEKFLHLNDQLKNGSGRSLSRHGYQYLRQNFTEAGDCEPFDLVDQVGQAYQNERIRQGFVKNDRDPNVTGQAFETVLQVLIGKLCGVTPSRTPGLATLSGFELAPVGYHSKPDLVLFGPHDFRLLISTKWTLRKERIGTYLHEAYFYKRRRPDVQVAFVVSEFNTNILRWLSQDPLTDRVYHVNRDMLLHLRSPFPGGPDADPVPTSLLLDPGNKTIERYRHWLNLHAQVADLSQLFTDISRLRDAPEQVIDPDPSDDTELEDM